MSAHASGPRRSQSGQRWASGARALCALAALTVLAPAFGAELTLDGGAGQYGQPYAFIGPQGTRAWEVYRKHWEEDWTRTPPVSIAAELTNPSRIVFSNLRYDNFDIGFTYASPGLFVATRPSNESPSSAAVSLVSLNRETARDWVEVRLGFIEQPDPEGDLVARRVVTTLGGDNSRSDLFYPWGADGLYVRLALSNFNARWTVRTLRAYRVAAASALDEPGRSYEIATGSGGAGYLATNLYELLTPSDTPLELGWRLVRSGAETTFEVSLGEGKVSWLVDTGAADAGFSDPSNPDGVDFEGGSFDSSGLVPVMFIGPGSPYRLSSADADGPSGTLELRVETSRPRFEAPPATAPSGTSFSIEVVARDEAGAIDPSYVSVVEFLSSDPAAQLPPPFRFTSAEAGRRRFDFVLHTPGPQRLTVRAQDVPELADEILIDPSPAFGEGAAPGDRLALAVGCGCGHGSAGGASLLLWLAVLVARRRRAAGSRGQLAQQASRRPASARLF